MAARLGAVLRLVGLRLGLLTEAWMSKNDVMGQDLSMSLQVGTPQLSLKTFKNRLPCLVLQCLFVSLDVRVGEPVILLYFIILTSVSFC